MWSLVGTFAVVGLLFLTTPDGVLHRLQQFGALFGSFAHPPKSEERLWLGLAVAYMTVITGITLLVAQDVGRYRPLLLVLAAGKFVSSGTCLVYFIDHNVFGYLANFIVDGLLTVVALGCWAITAKVKPAREVAQAAPG
jgi:hypothetical protein